MVTGERGPPQKSAPMGPLPSSAPHGRPPCPAVVAGPEIAKEPGFPSDGVPLNGLDVRATLCGSYPSVFHCVKIVLPVGVAVAECHARPVRVLIAKRERSVRRQCAVEGKRSRAEGVTRAGEHQIVVEIPCPACVTIDVVQRAYSLIFPPDNGLIKSVVVDVDLSRGSAVPILRNSVSGRSEYCDVG